MIDSTKFKRCGRKESRSDGSCGNVLYLEDFANNKHKPGGKEYFCRACMKRNRLKRELPAPPAPKKAKKVLPFERGDPLDGVAKIAISGKWGI